MCRLKRQRHPYVDMLYQDIAPCSHAYPSALERRPGAAPVSFRYTDRSGLVGLDIYDGNEDFQTYSSMINNLMQSHLSRERPDNCQSV